MNENVIGYLEHLLKRAKDGELEMTIVKTEFARKVELQYIEGFRFELEGDVDESQWTEVIQVKKQDRRVLA